MSSTTTERSKHIANEMEAAFGAALDRDWTS